MSFIVSKEGFNSYLVKLNLVWGLVAPLFLAILMNIVEVQGLFIFKDLLFYFSLFLMVLIGPSVNFVVFLVKLVWFVCFLFFLTIFFDGFKGWMVYNLRQLLAPILIVSFGYYIYISNRSLLKLSQFYYKSSIAIILVGVIIRQFNLWKHIDLTNYFNLKGIPVDTRGLSYMFYEPAFSYTERLASTILDPISLGHILAGAIIMCFYSVGIQGKKRIFYLIILGAGLILTFSKGAFLQVMLALFFFNKKLSFSTRFLIPALFVVLTLFLINIDGILIHMIGLKNAVIHMNLFGHGIGMVGNYAKMFSDDLRVYEYFEISDTFIGSVLGQIGIVGLVLWVSFFSRYLKSSFLNERVMVGGTIIASQLLVATLSENTLNFTSFLIPGFFGGLLASKRI